MSKKKTVNQAKLDYKEFHRQNRIEAKRVQTMNSSTAGRSGNSGVQDRGSGQRVARQTSHPLDRVRSSFQRAREWANLYYKEWTAQKIIDIPVEDMLREGWDYPNLDDDQAEAFDKLLKQLKFHDRLKQALRMERLLGGAVIIIGLADDEDDPSKPLDPDKIEEGDLQFINVIPRTKIRKTEYDQDPFLLD